MDQGEPEPARMTAEDIRALARSVPLASALRGPPKVSVCVITYNHERFIRDCLEGILAQETGFEFEVIVADDLSTDGTRRIIRELADEHPGRLRLLLPERKPGPSAIFAALHESARGEYVAHIDGDDLMYPGRLRAQAAFLDAHPGCAFVVHDVEILARSDDRRLAPSYLSHPVPEITDTAFLLERGCFFVHSSKMYRRSANAGIPLDRHVVDYYIHMYQSGHGSIGYIDRTLGAYRRGPGSISSVASPHFREVVDGHLAAFDLARVRGIDPARVAERAASFRYVHALMCLRGDNLPGFQHLIALDADTRRAASARHRLMAAVGRSPVLARILVAAFDAVAAARAP